MTARLFDARRNEFVLAPLREIETRDAPTTVWIDLFAPSREELVVMGELFNYHPLAIEDALKRKQRPKADTYSDHVFIVLYALQTKPESTDIEPLEISMFASRDVVITIHTDAVPEIDIAGKRWAEHCADRVEASSAMLVYTIIDTIVDGYFPCMDGIAEEIDLLESSLFEGDDSGNLQRIFRMKRTLVDIRRSVAPAREVLNAFTRREMPALGEESIYYFQDVYDHVIRATDQIDAHRDVLASAIDVHLSLVSNHMNQTVRTLTAASIVLMSLALVAGIYGMNFEHMPELGWRLGYFGALGIMALLGTALTITFRRLGWW